MFDLTEHPHKRQNILTGEWVLVSPHRSKRPWLGKVEQVIAETRPEHDPKCYLCPSNVRITGEQNPDYQGPYAFTNDHSSLLNDTPDGEVNIEQLLKATSQKGICRVICFSPKHNKSLPDLSKEELVSVIELWQQEFSDLAKNEWIKYVQIFENKGEIMGCSNPHPHGQIWSSNDIPVEIEKETKHQLAYYEKNGRSILSDYIKVEEKLNERVVYQNDHFIVLVPFWAVWPYETIIISKRHVQDIAQFTNEENLGFADVLSVITKCYDALFDVSFPYSAGMHQRPVNDDSEHTEWHWHMHFYPPLLRSASVKKFMVGYEMLANAQRDITPEFAAERLKDCLLKIS